MVITTIDEPVIEITVTEPTPTRSTPSPVELTELERARLTARRHPLWWREFAACRDMPLDLFITPEEGDDLDASPLYPETHVLIACVGCPVRTECLDWAMKHDEVGIWGGMTDYQRRQIGRPRERSSCPGCASEALVIENGHEVCLCCGVSWPVL